MFSGLCLKPPAYQFPAGPQQPTNQRATGTAMIVDSSQTPVAAKPTLVTESAVSSPSTKLAPRRYFLHREALTRSFSRHAEGGEFLRSQVAGRVSSCNKVRHDHPLNGLLANNDSGLIGSELTGRKSKPSKGDRTDEKPTP